MPELEEKSSEDFEDVKGLTYSLDDYPEVYESLEYKELSRRTEPAAKKIVEKDKEHRRKRFSIIRI